MSAYLALIKPRISLLFAVTGFTAIWVQAAGMEISHVIPSPQPRVAEGEESLSEIAQTFKKCVTL